MMKRATSGVRGLSMQAAAQEGSKLPLVNVLPSGSNRYSDGPSTGMRRRFLAESVAACLARGEASTSPAAPAGETPVRALEDLLNTRRSAAGIPEEMRGPAQAGAQGVARGRESLSGRGYAVKAIHANLPCHPVSLRGYC
jgi:hypothetical protein